ncbi:MLO-like protein 3 [Durio zibethinus]|uniref:MLO-like protein n=1 Tax=Durio zibethinus TaxID=66656 RepID=A0A6P6ALT0_DURZI|nr:MLO-like protein 3 [Durio zibethinus]
MEHSIFILSNWLKRCRKHALSDAVEKLKSELMVLGFISFLFAGSQSPISDICIPANIAYTLLPCRKKGQSKITKVQAYDQLFESKSTGNFGLYDDILWKIHRRLTNEDEATFSDTCSSKGKVSFMTNKGMQQLEQFIFVLAVMQIVYSFLTMALGRAKMRRWKAWEKETQTSEYQVAHSMAHFSGRYGNFNFHKYIERSLDEDFKTVVSISPLIWFIVVIFMLVDVHGWHVFLWVSFVPLLIVLTLGTKLEVIVARMAVQINNQNTVIRGTPLVQPNDELFWFRRPQFVPTPLHFTLFTNAFELAFFIYPYIQFGLDSCYHERTTIVITRIILPITVQVLCSYITLPLYALVTQMGSELKSPVLEDQITQIMRQWHAGVRERRKKQELLQSPAASLSTELSSRTDSPAEIFPSFPLPSLTLSESIQLSNRGEIMEEQDKIVEVEASSSDGPS